MSENTILSHYEIEEIDFWLKRYPTDQKRSAVLAALRAVMHEDHYLSTSKMDAVAEYLELEKIEVYEVASFYSMYTMDEKHAAKHTIAICTNISCMLNGSDKIVDHVESKFGIKHGESTEDGKFYLKVEEECLAACCGAPMMQVDHVYYENLTTDKVDQILEDVVEASGETPEEKTSHKAEVN